MGGVHRIFGGYNQFRQKQVTYRIRILFTYYFRAFFIVNNLHCH